ncbi:unnamed protein product [Blepharisma stoltei]|uniref:GTP-binding protein n=1 Tax=Blepharisma stoltei TaxID=1481888 RepID=A0AAU9IG42_9CILI|nr:unnamed protein product [Blepharisma stoltei]
MKKEVHKSIIVIGEYRSGKASIITRYCSNEIYGRKSDWFESGFKSKNITQRHQTIKLMVWKTPVKPAFRDFSSDYYSGPYGWLVVFDLTNRESFDYISFWVGEIRKHGNQANPIFIVGNKSDLKKKRQVSYEEAKMLADSFNVPYADVSVLYNHNLDTVFSILLKEMTFNKK